MAEGRKKSEAKASTQQTSWNKRNQSRRPDRRIGLQGLEIRPWSRSIANSLGDLCLEFWSHLLKQLDTAQVLEQLRDVLGADDYRIEVLIFEGPGQHQLQEAVPQLLGELAQSQESFAVLGSIDGVKEILAVFGELRQVVPSSLLGLALEVLASEVAAGERAPGDEAIFVVAQQPQVVHLRLLPVEHVVVVLRADGPVQVQPLADGQRLGDALGRPVGGRPVEAEPGLDDLVETAADLLQGRALVEEVGVHHVHVVQLQAGEAPPQSLADVLAVDGQAGVEIGLGRREDLRGDHHVLAGDVELFEDSAQLRLGLARGVDFGSVEVVDAVGEAGADEFLIGCQALRGEVEQLPHGDGGHPQSGVAEIAVQHLLRLQS